MERASADAPAGSPAPRPWRQAWTLFLLTGLLPGCWLFGDVLFRDRTFVNRDAGHFYYPLGQLVRQQWREGLPLWNPGENCGEPLAAQPTATVFYPGQLALALPYPVAFKAYLLGHWCLAWWSAYLAARGFGVRPAAAALAGASYAGSAFVIFQLYNTVFLVGAAWLPLGLRLAFAAGLEDSRRAAHGLAAVLALQVLGGDPQVALFTLFVGVAAALVARGGPGRLALFGLLAAGHALIHVGQWWPEWPAPPTGLLEPSFADRLFAQLDAAGRFPEALSASFLDAWRRFPRFEFPLAGAAAGAAALLFARRSVRHALPWRLLGAGAFAGLLSAAQTLPTRELVKLSDRGSPDAPLETMAFSTFPARLAELVIPAAFGRQLPEQTRWAPFFRHEGPIWTPSLYLGIAAVVAALSALRFRRAPAPVVALSWLLPLALWAACGKFGGVGWLFDPMSGKSISQLTEEYGHRLPATAKEYGHSDGFYGLIEQTVPMVRSFRYPEKVFVFAAAAFALLAALGAEQALRRRAFVAPLFVLLLFAPLLAPAAFRFVVPEPDKLRNSFGPFDPARAAADFRQAWLHGAAALAAVALAARFAPARHRPLALALFAAADLAVAHRWLTLTDRQSAVDAKPKAQEILEADAARRGETLYRVFRPALFHPPRFLEARSPERIAEMTRWERETLQPKYGVPAGLHFAETAGTMAVYDVAFFLRAWNFTTPPALKGKLRNDPKFLTYHPRNGFNAWNARYFLLPRYQMYDHHERGQFTLERNADGQRAPVLAESPPEQDDWQLLRNDEALPRAWLVHAAEFMAPIAGQRRIDRKDVMERLTYRPFDGGANVWAPLREAFPYRERALLEVVEAHRHKLAPFLAGGPTAPAEEPRLRHYRSQAVEFEVAAQRPGLLVLADAWYPGWHATVDGLPAPLLKANRAMRAVPVPAGTHVVAFHYPGTIVKVGVAISLAAWLAWLRRWRSLRRLAPAGPAPSA